MFIFGMIILAVLLFGVIAGVYWLTGRYFSMWGMEIKKRTIRGVRLVISLLAVVSCMNGGMVSLIIIHVFVVFLLTELVVSLIRRLPQWKRRKHPLLRRIYRIGIVPVLFVCIVSGYGYYNMRHVGRMDYTVVSGKLSQDYKVVLITDTHYDTIQDPAILQEKIQEINAVQPDVVVLGGDIVEEGTSKESMEEVFQRLGSIQNKYGIYYVYGNHDRQHYTGQPAYTEEELASTITANGITILDDRVVTLAPDLVLAGREDVADASGRLSTEELLGDVSGNPFLIVADHQPVEVHENAKYGVDLEVSGHTHAGQIFPIGCFNELVGLNYGRYQVENCTAIVSSGFAGWGFPARTQGKCEYVVISLEKE